MLNLNVYQPWSAPLLRTSLPDKTIQELIQLTDIIIKDNDRISHNKNLAGEIEDEWTIDPILLINIKFKDFLFQLCVEYFKNFALQFELSPPNEEGISEVPIQLAKMKNKIDNIQITQAWFNEQKDNEYNPLHDHSGYFSGVLYLKIPEYLPSRKTIGTDGSICFVESGKMQNNMTTAAITIAPKVGDIFLFPSSLKHQVYPFRTADEKGIRRSLSFNLDSKE